MNEGNTIWMGVNYAEKSTLPQLLSEGRCLSGLLYFCEVGKRSYGRGCRNKFHLQRLKQRIWVIFH